MPNIIPESANHHAQHLLAALLLIKEPTEEQRRFIGSLRKAMGMQSNNERRKS